METRRMTVPTRPGAALRDMLIALVAGAAALLVAVVLLTRGSVQAGEAQSLSNLRQIGEGFASYAAFAGGAFPFVESGESIPLGPEDDAPTVTMGEGGALPWALETLWFAITPVGDSWHDGAEIVRSPGGAALEWPLDGRPSAWGARASVSYHYSNSFVADPASWPAPPPESDAGAAPSAGGAPVLRATLVAEVAQPSRKTLLLDADRFYLADEDSAEATRPLAFVDNSAFARRDDDAFAPAPCLAPRGEGAWRWPSARVYHDTALGVKGREF